jgi:hypothetical protein
MGGSLAGSCGFASSVVPNSDPVVRPVVLEQPQRPNATSKTAIPEAFIL